MRTMPPKHDMIHLPPHPDKSVPFRESRFIKRFKATGALVNWFIDVLYTYRPAGALSQGTSEA